MTHAPSADERPQATLSTPVVFFIFNRPQETAQVWQAIRTTRPARLYIVSDAPRPGVAGEASRVQECRKIAESIDWPCQVETDYAVQNLGCGARISSGLNKVFSREERAIILEDDTVPEPSFFRFCETLLERYADHKQVYHINGRNNLMCWDTDDSYFFARRSNPWGWATWRRAWRSFDLRLEPVAAEEIETLTQILRDRKHAEFIHHTANKYAGRSIDTWDIQWSLSIIRQGGLCIVPQSNLVRNIGFGPSATHTSNTRHDMRADLPVLPAPAELLHPGSVKYLAVGQKFDRFYFLFEQLNTYNQPGVMILLSRLLASASPGDDLPGHQRLRSLIPFLNPAQDPAETRELLLHLKEFIPENQTLENLLKYF